MYICLLCKFFIICRLIDEAASLFLFLKGFMSVFDIYLDVEMHENIDSLKY